jgi:hypothetical protein
VWGALSDDRSVCSFQLLLGIASTVFLGLSPAGLMSIIFLSFVEKEINGSLVVETLH